MSKNRISPLIGVLICINTMIGAGLFINSKQIVPIAGAYSFLGYVFAGLLMLPIILSIATLAKLHPVSGGLYVFSKSYISDWAGFLSGWGYFIGKTTSVALLMHKFNTFFQAQFSVLSNVPTIAMDYCFIFLLILLNLAGASVGGRVQYVFTTLKALPILFVFGVGFYSFDPLVWSFGASDFSSIFLIVPLCVFPTTGFEIICSVGHLVEDPARNIKKVILTAFFIVVSINTIFQFLIYGSLGSMLGGVEVPILGLAQKALPSLEILGRVLNGFVYAAILGACFSILTTNCWNLYTLADNNHIPFKRFFTKISSKNVPWVAILSEGFLSCLVLTVSNDQTALTSLSVFAQLIAIFLSMFAAYKAVGVVATAGLYRFIPVLGLGTSLYILTMAIFNICKSGVSFSFLAIFLIGIFLAIFKKVSQKRIA